MEPLKYIPGKKTVYSDLGFMILEWIIEVISGKRLDSFVHDEIYNPLGLDNLFFVDHEVSVSEQFLQKSYAATERCPWRERLIEGRVHDDNAYVVGGISGQAGLFGTVLDVNALLTEMMSSYYGNSEKYVFDNNLVKFFFKPQKCTDRVLGFDTPSQSGSSSGNCFSKRTVGHLGFTGTSFWMDLNHRIIVLLLTNRVHPHRDNIKIREFRPEIHNAVMKYAI